MRRIKYVCLLPRVLCNTDLGAVQGGRGNALGGQVELEVHHFDVRHVWASHAVEEAVRGNLRRGKRAPQPGGLRTSKVFLDSL